MCLFNCRISRTLLIKLDFQTHNLSEKLYFNGKQKKMEDRGNGNHTVS
jgi:hypothetical protein